MSTSELPCLVHLLSIKMMNLKRFLGRKVRSGERRTGIIRMFIPLLRRKRCPFRPASKYHGICFIVTIANCLGSSAIENYNFVFPRAEMDIGNSDLTFIHGRTSSEPNPSSLSGSKPQKTTPFGSTRTIRAETRKSWEQLDPSKYLQVRYKTSVISAVPSNK